ncbi:hypothetical protein HFK83_03245 [Ralstonia pseudosolanacearum]|uniref:hypothetical protein n=1 Tax=Ralstonia solanacearum species complex TaxID=3116862 RepID=UPI000C1FC514|nr:hypothetical protein [Ralstonia pseudosolanacearum]MCK4121387.1 hypothetical protein [Ralstonia pseudosolanacearum]
MLILLLALNFGVSWLNCWSVGGMWAESKALGGFPRLLAWCGAIQAAIGFSSVIGAVLGAIAFHFGLLPAKATSQATSLWYLLVIVPAIGSGLIITVHSWIIAFRERSILNMGTAAYNTLTQAHNMLGAFRNMGGALESVADLFASDDDEPSVAVLVVALVAVALAGGVLLTAYLIRRYAGRLELPAKVMPA